MTESQFAEFMETILPPYAAERATADHVSLASATRYAREQHERLLPDGRLTAGHSFRSVVTVGTDRWVGGAWFVIDAANAQAFVYNITVFPSERRRGYAREALALVEDVVRQAGCRSLGLNVFASNDGAIALYRALGFRVAASYMSKPL